MKKSELKSTTSISVIVEQLKKKANPMIRQVESLPIKTKDDYNKAAKLISQLKEFSKEAERQEKTFTDPAKQIIKNAQEFFRPFRYMISEIEWQTKAKMVTFQDKQQKLVEKLHEDLDSGKIKKLSTVVSKENELLDTSSTDASVRKVWQLNIVNEKLIPREFLVPDETAIRAAFKSGNKVAGCEWKQVNQIAI